MLVLLSAGTIVLGSAGFLAERGIDVKALAASADQLRQDGATAIFAGIDGRAAGVLAIADPVKPTTPAAPMPSAD